MDVIYKLATTKMLVIHCNYVHHCSYHLYSVLYDHFSLATVAFEGVLSKSSEFLLNVINYFLFKYSIFAIYRCFNLDRSFYQHFVVIIFVPHSIDNCSSMEQVYS